MLITVKKKRNRKEKRKDPEATAASREKHRVQKDPVSHRFPFAKHCNRNGSAIAIKSSYSLTKSKKSVREGILYQFGVSPKIGAVFLAY